MPGQHADHIAARYERIRQARQCERDPATIQNVFVLSRVTLGADVAITSVMLDAAKQRFPGARIWFVGPRKNWELFQADARLSHLPIAYGRSGMLDDRLSIWHELREAVSKPDSIVIDPDSRLTQLGLLPICAEDDYYFFESRSYGAATDAPLSTLASRWVAETFGVSRHAAVYRDRTGRRALRDDRELRRRRESRQAHCRSVRRRAARETAAAHPRSTRVPAAKRPSAWSAPSRKPGGGIEMWEGSFAGFAEHIARSRLYVGYDSAGGHVASACGIPAIIVFSPDSSANGCCSAGARRERTCYAAIAWMRMRWFALQPVSPLRLLDLLFDRLVFGLVLRQWVGRIELDGASRFELAIQTELDVVLGSVTVDARC